LPRYPRMLAVRGYWPRRLYLTLAMLAVTA
jgi:hypothetical protein